MSILQYEMPTDGSYALQSVASFTLPVAAGTGPDIANGSSILWMAVNNEARHLSRAQLPCYRLFSLLRGCAGARLI